LTSGFAGLITSKTRVAIIMRLFLNPERGAYLRELASEIGCSTSQVSGELKQLSRSGYITCAQNGRQHRYQANTEHALFPELQSMVRKALGMDRIIESILERLGALELALLLDDYAEGKDTGIIDLLLVGDIDQRNLIDLVAKTERYIDRKIRTLCLTRDEYERMHARLEQRPHLLLWNAVDVTDAAQLAAGQSDRAASPMTHGPVEDRPNG
jgi:DNA-binding MarR family transcriptional regulator